MKADEQIYVRPVDGEFEVQKPSHRRGPRFANEELAVEHATGLADVVLVLNRTGKVEREVRAEDDLDALVAEYYEALAGEGKDRDGHWTVAQRWSYGEYLGWFVEHLGYGGSSGLKVDEDEGPFATTEEARGAMATRLRAAIAEVEGRLG